MECGFRIHASPMQGERTFQIKSLQPKHNCGRSYNNHLVNSRYLSNKYLEKLRNNPGIGIEAFKNEVKRDLAVDVSKYQVYRAKRKAKETIEEDLKQQYARLRDYAATVRLHNPRTWIKIMTERPSAELPLTFCRIYVRYHAQLHGFVNGCRPIIGLDGCFLKGVYGGQLLSAVGRDGNENMFPLAIAVVEAENKESWSWFLELLLDDIGGVENMGWCFISDRQKGLEATFAELMPNTEHRFCLRHIYANFSKKFKGKELKDCLWKVASTGTVSEFQRQVKKMAAMDKNACEWL